MFAFSEERKRLIGDNWKSSEIGSQTALGDALGRSLDQSVEESESLLDHLSFSQMEGTTLVVAFWKWATNTGQGDSHKCDWCGKGSTAGRFENFFLRP